MSDTDRAPDLELEEERREIELERLELEATAEGRVLLRIGNRLIWLSERLRVHAEDEQREMQTLRERVAALEHRLAHSNGQSEAP